MDDDVFARRLLLPLACLFSVSAVAQGDIGSVLLPDGSVYDGPLVDGLFHGEGEIVSPSGDRVAGEFEKGLLHGHAEAAFHHGTKVHGTFQEGANGTGVIEYVHGDRYEGQMSAWQPHGAGVYESAQGDRYQGEFDYGQPTGAFVVELAGESRYEGGLDNWLFHGTGEFVTVDGTRYSGSFDNGSFHGEGIIDYASGDRYEGEVEYWEPHGRGEFTYADGTRYVGEFSYGRFDGQGELWKSDGERYSGGFSYGRYDGEGTLYRGEEPTEVNGRWQNGFFAGENASSLIPSGLSLPDVESVFFAQNERVARTLDRVAAGVPDREDWYIVGAAPYGGQDVFFNEIELLRQRSALLTPHVSAVALLSNNPKTHSELPLAIRTNLDGVFGAIADRMNEEDVLFLYVTSHGSRDGELSVTYPGVSLRNIDGRFLKESLDRAGIKWRALILSACFSGSLIESLKDPHSLIMTSASADNTSFGCSDDAELTYFGEALLQQGIQANRNLEEAFQIALEAVTQRELSEEYEPSQPQLWIGEAYRKHKL